MLVTSGIKRTWIRAGFRVIDVENSIQNATETLLVVQVRFTFVDLPSKGCLKAEKDCVYENRSAKIIDEKIRMNRKELALGRLSDLHHHAEIFQHTLFLINTGYIPVMPSHSLRYIFQYHLDLCNNNTPKYTPKQEELALLSGIKGTYI